ncbi:hypothetical protein [Kribbella sp. NPDC023855]|uniref:hypothetical protein n=1 Tax=Kribbella sp. NPDC023855 TaxID=3154698 RepID=UPI0033D19B94
MQVGMRQGPVVTTVTSDRDVDELVEAMTSATSGVVLQGPRRAFTLDLIETLTAATVRRRIPLSIELTDLAHLPQRPADRTAGQLVVEAHAAADTTKRRAELTRPVEMLAVVGHGDGMHLNLGSVVLCGRTAEVESAAGLPVPGGCARGRCKKGATGQKLMTMDELSCRVLVLLSCTSMLLAPQMYPGDNSLAVAALQSGSVAAVVGTTRQTASSRSDVEHLRNLMSTGRTLAEAVAELNVGRDADRQGFLVVLGDPTVVLSDPPTEPISGGGTAEARKPPASPLLSRLRDMDRLERTVAFVASKSLQEPAAIVTGVSRWSAARTRLNAAAWSAHAHQVMRGSVPPAVETSLASAAQEWIDIGAELLADGLLSEAHPGAHVGDLLQPSLRLWLESGERVQIDGRCAQCGGHIFATPLRLTSVGQVERWISECAVCGLACNICGPGGSPPGPNALQIETNSRRLIVDLTLPAAPAAGAGLVVLQIRDKTKPQPLPISSWSLASGQARLRAELDLPGDPGSDIWSARAVVLRDGNLDFYRRVFHYLPPRDGGAR